MFRNLKFLITLLLLFLISANVFSQAKPLASFKIVPLGVKGGIDESNLSAYMVAAAGTNNYICLDAGTLHYGIEKAISNKVFNIPAGQVLRQYIKGYFISHAHLDHIAGLIINSPDDTAKNIYALASCIKTIQANYFTWESWANFADEGEAPKLNKYHYQVLTPDSTIAIANTAMTVQAFSLSHSNLISTAFLVQSHNAYILYLGDTGADSIEKSHNLHNLWVAIAPLIKNKQLKAIMIETSFPDAQPDKTLFGHLTPKWLMNEMANLALLTGNKQLNGFNIIITHVKPPQTNIDKLKIELNNENLLKLNLIYPEQGKPICL